MIENAFNLIIETCQGLFSTTQEREIFLKFIQFYLLYFYANQTTFWFSV